MFSIKHARTHSEYRYILIAFLMLSIILISFLTIYSVSSVKIIVYLPSQPKTKIMEFEVSENPDKNDSLAIAGTVAEEKISLTKNFQPTKTETAPQKLSGTITIVNNTAKDQPLISGTRLLSDNGVLFRTKKTITVPARQSIEIEAQSDETAASEIAVPQKFTVVALWPGLQDKIYGKINSPIIPGQSIIRLTTQQDIDNAKTELEKELYLEGVDNLRAKNASGKIKESLIVKELIAFSHTGKLNEAQDEFSASATLRLLAILVDGKEIKNRLLTEQEGVVSSKKADSTVPDPELKISSLDLKNNAVRITAKISVPPPMPEIDPFVKKSLTGKTPQEINDYFKRAVFAKKTEIKTFPLSLPIIIAPAQNLTIAYVSAE